MSKAARIENYVDIAVEVGALEEAATLDGMTEDRQRLIKQAKNRLSETLRSMTGGDLSKARKLLAERRLTS
jgi:hypothetical protein